MDYQTEATIKIEKITTAAMLEQCTELFINVFNQAPWNHTWNSDAANALFTCYYDTPDYMGWVALQDNQVVGCAMGNTEPHYSGKVFYLRELFVAPSLQKKGIGRRLIADVKKRLEEAGTNTIILFTRSSVFDYYSKLGFSELKEMGMMEYNAIR